jgi:DNA replication and repair protein RecF
VKSFGDAPAGGYNAGNQAARSHIIQMLGTVEDVLRSAAAAAPAAPLGRVAVARLTLTDFRNYRDARLVLGPEPVVLTGANGAGKTNLLEALSFLAPGRGLRGARLAEIDRRETAAEPMAAPAMSHGWAVAAVIATRHGSLRIGTGRDAGARPADPAQAVGAEKRVVRIDGVPAKSQGELGERLGVVWLTPAMDRLFLEGPSGRRRFLDRLALALDPAHAAHVGAYEEALRERSRILRDGYSLNRPPDRAWLAALEQVMAEQGVAVAAGRRDLIRLLDRACAEAEGPFPRARLTLSGVVEGWLDAMPALAAEAKLAAALAAGRREDAQSGGAAIGPHRSDLDVALMDGRAANGTAGGLASTGEQKALLISIVLAYARLQRAVRGDAPLLLLDEVAAHLDAGRRAALFAALIKSESQAWITGTEPALFAPLRGQARFLSVRAGTLSPTLF